MAKFFGKNPHKKYVRQFSNSIVKHIIQPKVDKKETIEENKEIKKDKEMADERLEKIENIIGSKAPKRKVKMEKKKKILI